MQNREQKHTCQPPKYKNLETNPKMFKVGAIFICGPFFLFLDFIFQCYNLQYITYEING